MNKKLKYALIGIGITGAIGASVYIYKKYKKEVDTKASEEDGIMTVEEMQKMLAEKKARGPLTKSPEAETEEKEKFMSFDMDAEIEAVKMSWSLAKEQEAQRVAAKKKPSEILDDIEEVDGIPVPVINGKPLKIVRMSEEERAEDKRLMEEEERDMEQAIADQQAEDDIDWERKNMEPKFLEDEGARILRHDPNSDEALTQFMKMELAEWAPHEDQYKTLLRMFEVPFDPVVEGDVHLKNKIMDERSDFFGDNSKWLDRVSYGDLILYYSRRLEFSYSQGIRFWVDKLLRINGLDPHVTESELYMQLKEYNERDYDADNIGNTKVGLFQLDKRRARDAEYWAQNRVDGEVTYDIEFEEFKKMVQGDDV